MAERRGSAGRAAESAAASATLRASGRPCRPHPHPSIRLYPYLILLHACNANDFLNVTGLEATGRSISVDVLFSHNPDPSFYCTISRDNRTVEHTGPDPSGVIVNIICNMPSARSCSLIDIYCITFLRMFQYHGPIENIFLSNLIRMKYFCPINKIYGMFLS